MGKKFAPAYANTYMANWEETVLPNCQYKPTHYFRFLDDTWGTWPHREEKFHDYLQILNDHHEAIKVKRVLNDKEIIFLDTPTYKSPQFDKTGKLDIRV